MRRGRILWDLIRMRSLARRGDLRFHPRANTAIWRAQLTPDDTSGSAEGPGPCGRAGDPTGPRTRSAAVPSTSRWLGEVAGAMGRRCCRVRDAASELLRPTMRGPAFGRTATSVHRVVKNARAVRARPLCVAWPPP